MCPSTPARLISNIQHFRKVIIITLIYPEAATRLHLITYLSQKSLSLNSQAILPQNTSACCETQKRNVRNSDIGKHNTDVALASIYRLSDTGIHTRLLS